VCSPYLLETCDVKSMEKPFSHGSVLEKTYEPWIITTTLFSRDDELVEFSADGVVLWRSRSQSGQNLKSSLWCFWVLFKQMTRTLRIEERGQDKSKANRDLDNIRDPPCDIVGG
jgi:hypothetical protein